MYDGQIVHIGKSALFDEVDGKPVPEDLAERVNSLSADGRTTMIVRHGERYLGVIGLMDTPREAAKSVIARLRDIGVTRMMMISGDNQNVADAVARDVGLDEAFGDLMPDDKVTKIKSLKQGRGVAMVGDGVNDAPAMANATVGIAMGAAGSDVALETADIALMADDLETLPFAVGLSRATSRIIRQNLWASLGIVAFLIPATLFGLGIGPAVLIHEGSTLIVVFNALRLLAFQDREH
jgi:Cd2+/Zn2+-exporting ATPase